jgi:metalloprotease ARX1
VNSCIRGYSPLTIDEGYILCEGDIVTVSLGVHIDGYACFSSHTIHIQSQPAAATGRLADAVGATHFATNALVNCLATGTTGQFRAVVKEAADTFGVGIVQGSCLRRIRRFLVGQTTIEEFDSKVLEFNSSVEGSQEFNVEQGDVYLIDLAFSTGTGEVHFLFPCMLA